MDSKWLDKVELLTVAHGDHMSFSTIISHFTISAIFVIDADKQRKFNLCHVSTTLAPLSSDVLWHSKPLPSTHKRAFVCSQCYFNRKWCQKDENGHYGGMKSETAFSIDNEFWFGRMLPDLPFEDNWHVKFVQNLQKMCLRFNLEVIGLRNAGETLSKFHLTVPSELTWLSDFAQSPGQKGGNAAYTSSKCVCMDLKQFMCNGLYSINIRPLWNWHRNGVSADVTMT